MGRNGDAQGFNVRSERAAEDLIHWAFGMVVISDMTGLTFIVLKGIS
jgi:tryptophan synthase alpha subunit